MFLNITPIIKTPFTDLVGNIGHHQYYGRCADFEMKMMNCFEAYGLERGKVKCKDIIDDFEECHLMTKQVISICSFPFSIYQVIHALTL